MGNRDKPKNDPKKPKKNDPRVHKVLLPSPGIGEATPVPELVRKKKRNEPLPDEGLGKRP